MPILTVQNALVRSAAVEIRSLTVSGRQVTQAVFRQVPVQEILQVDGSLAGPVWGWVNYWKEQERWGREPLHVLWQDGIELRRCIVRRPHIDDIHAYNRAPPQATLSNLHQAVSRDVQRAYRLSWCHDPANPPRGFNIPPFGPIDIDIDRDGPLSKAIRLRNGALSEDRSAARDHHHHRTSTYPSLTGEQLAAERQLMLEEVERYRAEKLAGDDYEAACRDLGQLSRRAVQVLDTWRASYDTCHAAGQLFIAC
jgi:hypothetical protein